MNHGVGRLFVVVGPSGVGKDSLIEFARSRLASTGHIRFVRRIITRPADSGGETHDAMSEEAFVQLEQHGSFAVSWQAHGLRYGIPAAVKHFIDQGGIAVANGSRHALPYFAAAFPNLTVVSITADPEILTMRLRLRGRESEADIQKRLNRIDTDYSKFGDVITIDNSGPLDLAGNRLVAVINAPGSPSRAASNVKTAHQAEGAFERHLGSSWPFV